MLRFALGNLLSSPLRSSLALAGLTIAIGGMVVLFAITEGIGYAFHQAFEQIPGLAVQQRGAPLPLFSTLPTAWGDEIQQLPGVHLVEGEVVQRLNLIDGKMTISPPRFLVGFDLPVRQRLHHEVYRHHIVAGRGLEAADAGTNHCLVSRAIAREAGKHVGDTLLLNQFPAQIVGIYEIGSLLLDVNVLMDLRTVRQIMRIPADTVSCFYVEPDEGIDKEDLKMRIEKLFAGRTGFSPSTMPSELNVIAPFAGQLLKNLIPSSPPTGDAAKPGATSTPPGDAVDPEHSAVEVRLADDWGKRFAEFTGDLDLFLMLITVMAVTIAVLSIVNTMMMSVSERTIEFGILRANGWSKRHVIQLIIYESGCLGVVGGIAGSGLGWCAAGVINRLFSNNLQLHAGPPLLLFGVLVSTVLGIAGGLYPAWSAARRSPMEAIRRA